MRNGIILILLTTYYLLHTTYALAFTSQGDNYIFNMHVGLGTDEDQNQSYNQPPKAIIKPQIRPSNTPTPTPTVIVPPKTTIELGYPPADDPTKDFRFGINQDIINFGPLSPTDFITRESLLTINGSMSDEYTISLFENHELANEKNQKIPNTRCDNSNCTESYASGWTDPLTFGFGFSCENQSGKDCSMDFTDRDSFRQIPVTSTDYNGSITLSGNTNQEKKANIFYKINVPGTQPPGNYQNTLVYIATPGY